MQSYVLNLAVGAVRAFDVPADLFVYESGAPTPTTGDTRIKIKPNTGAEIVLRPGQRFRLAPNSDATHWEVSALDPAVAIVGYVIIGAGEFDDANTLNKVTLDATFANQVTVTNTPAARVPVTLDTNQLLKLDPNNSISSAAPVMAYTNAKSNISLPASAAANLITAAENVNGVIFEQIVHSLGGGGVLLAKATAPTGPYDGEVLNGLFAPVSGPATVTQRIKVTAGKGVWVWNSHGSTIFVGNVLYTVL
jgi:hypothetical protein